MTFGYLFPGWANEILHKLLKTFRKNIVFDTTNGKLMELRKTMMTGQPVRLRFGAVNYYEKGTLLVMK